MSMRDTKRCPGMKALHSEPSSWKSNQPMKMKGQLRIKSYLNTPFNIMQILKFKGQLI